MLSLWQSRTGEHSKSRHQTQGHSTEGWGALFTAQRLPRCPPSLCSTKNRRSFSIPTAPQCKAGCSSPAQVSDPHNRTAFPVHPLLSFPAVPCLPDTAACSSRCSAAHECYNPHGHPFLLLPSAGKLTASHTQEVTALKALTRFFLVCSSLQPSAWKEPFGAASHLRLWVCVHTTWITLIPRPSANDLPFNTSILRPIQSEPNSVCAVFRIGLKGEPLCL